MVVVGVGAVKQRILSYQYSPHVVVCGGEGEECAEIPGHNMQSNAT